MICKKCGALYAPPLNTHPQSYAAARCYECYLEYVNVLLKTGKNNKEQSKEQSNERYKTKQSQGLTYDFS